LSLSRAFNQSLKGVSLPSSLEGFSDRSVFASRK
jgi:hypothetical protein